MLIKGNHKSDLVKITLRRNVSKLCLFNTLDKVAFTFQTFYEENPLICYVDKDLIMSNLSLVLQYNKQIFICIQMWLKHLK